VVATSTAAAVAAVVAQSASAIMAMMKWRAICRVGLFRKVCVRVLLSGVVFF
jgi:hypothetical protein